MVVFEFFHCYDGVAVSVMHDGIGIKLVISLVPLFVHLDHVDYDTNIQTRYIVLFF